MWEKFCIWYCAIVWIVFGALHFTGHDITMAMMPPFMTHEGFNSFAVYLTGFMEVGAGIGLLFLKTRRWSALLSIVNLILILPATIYIAFWPDATPFFEGTTKTIFQMINIPNSILMFICSLYLWRGARQ